MGIASPKKHGSFFPEETDYPFDWYIVQKAVGNPGFLGLFRQPATGQVAVFRHKGDADKAADMLTKLFHEKYVSSSHACSSLSPG